MVTLHETPFILEYRIAFRLHFVERLANDADFMHLMSTHLSLMHVAPFGGSRSDRHTHTSVGEPNSRGTSKGVVTPLKVTAHDFSK